MSRTDGCTRNQNEDDDKDEQPPRCKSQVGSPLRLKNTRDVTDAFNVDPLYLRHDHQGQQPDYRHWQIPLSRRFRSLKLWFVMRLYGRQGLQDHIRKQIALAHEFEALVREDSRFEIFFPVTLGLVSFRLKNESNDVNDSLLKSINASGIIHMVPSKAKDTYFLRFVVCSRFTEHEDIVRAWQEVKKMADKVQTKH
ncbi:aromatic-L-amino-acid decarboxylase-like [Penaeus indicus]|uniref:aromatic-L-amino-acid decarboxylase-like n=1 Tax=Penaeus indicus TaxID=29960 RepID=UPI00300DAE5F